MKTCKVSEVCSVCGEEGEVETSFSKVHQWMNPTPYQGNRVFVHSTTEACYSAIMHKQTMALHPVAAKTVNRAG